MALPRIPQSPIGRELWLLFAREQVGTGILREVDAILLDAFKEIARRLILDGDQLSPNQQARNAGLFRTIGDLLAERYGAVDGLVTSRLEEYSTIEALIALDDLTARVGTLAQGIEAQLSLLTRRRVIAIADVFFEGRSMPEWWRTQATAMTDAARRQVQIGLTLGEGPAELVRRIVPPRASVEPAVYRTARRNATAVVRSGVTGVAAQTSIATYQAAAPGLTERYALVAVRDGRTTPICRALDGMTFRYDDPDRRTPPFHFNCRTVIRPVIDYAGTGIAPSREAGPGGFKDYTAWLQAQPTSIQDQILGPARAAMWRAGKVTLSDMVATDGRTLTLEQLRALVESP